MSSSVSSISENSKKDDKKLTLKKKDVKRMKTENSEEDDSDENTFDTEYHQPSDLINKLNKKKALDTLLTKRRVKKDGLIFYNFY